MNLGGTVSHAGLKQFIEPSHLLSSINIVSIVFSLFHWYRHGNRCGSTYVQSTTTQSTRDVIHLSSPLINAGEIDFGDKLDRWWGIWVGISTMNVQAVDPILMGTLLFIKSLVFMFCSNMPGAQRT